MLKVTFISNINKDIENIFDKCTKKVPFGNFNLDPKLRILCDGKSFEEAKKGLNLYLKKIYSTLYIEEFRKSSERLWQSIEQEFFVRMNSLMKNKYEKNIKAYITTIPICPYNPDEPSFMISNQNSLQIAMSICGHEIMHLYFHDFYWDKVERQIGEKKTGDLKEALTVLLNLEFKDLWLVNDRGYEEHKELRNFISNTWKEEKDFDRLLERCVNHLKKN